MRKRFTCICGALACAVLSPLASQDNSLSGSLSAQTGYGLPNTHDNKGHVLTGLTAFNTVFKSYQDESMVYVDASILYDGIGSLSSNGTESMVSDDGRLALKLKEAYFDYNGSWWSLRAGRQIAAWGKADGIQIADILCPQDSSVLLATDYKETRLGIDALRLSLNGNAASLDAYWIPFFTPSTLPLAGGNPLHAVLFPSSASVDSETIAISAPESMSDLETPEKKLSNSEYALRLTAYLSALDLSLYGFYGWDDLPFISYTGEFAEDEESGDYYLSGLSLSGTYKRVLMGAFDAAIPAGDLVLRFEGAFFPNRYMQTNAAYQLAAQLAGEKDYYAKKQHQAVGLAGFDWEAGNGWTITAQYVADGIFADKDEIEKLDRRRFEQQVTLSIEKLLLNETLTLSASGALDLRDYSSATELSAEYSLSDAIKLSVIGNLFLEGPDDKEGMYGAYHDLSAVTVKGKICF